MSTEYALDPPMSYDEVKASLPPGITIYREFKPSDPAGPQPDGTAGRPYVPEIEHCLIQDACGNRIWMRKARESDVGQYGVERLGDAVFERFGDAVFERFGMGGGLVHTGQAFKDAGYTLFDVETTVTWDSESWKCRKCGAQFEPVDYFIVVRPGHRLHEGDEDEEDDQDGTSTP